MNRSSSVSLALSRAITGFLTYKTAEGLSDRSVDSYKRSLQQWADYTGEVQIQQLTSQNVDDYLVYLRNEYVPRWFGGIFWNVTMRVGEITQFGSGRMGVRIW